MSSKLGIIAALPFEAACFTSKKISPGTYQIVAPDVYLFFAGMGPENATQAAQTLVGLNVDALVSWGVAGALDSRLVSGDILLPGEILDQDGEVYHVDRDWYAALKYKLNQQGVYAGGRLVSTPNVQQDIRLKSELHQATQALAVDMESAAVARVARNAEKPFVVIRSVFDTVAMRIPASSTKATDQYGHVSITKLLVSLIKSPVELLQYPRLVSSFNKAKKGLQQVVTCCGHQLCFSEKI